MRSDNSASLVNYQNSKHNAMQSYTSEKKRINFILKNKLKIF